ncbi:hypothetical protein KP509_31G009300 [Ceratopteris richardii]|uniref:t-SNARE coiled-coil homology domain-containing protein n=1 Tax=Ceratopteris richardii TaxID=49495 RepID=A0A8T2QVZ8_CERRI|nr:hypothetical protein KP509_31G009300 [Ceratopteris richardii]KAH7288048.1 hypothetical protein KP509_31G009300 [Ceratopteris richardii]
MSFQDVENGDGSIASSSSRQDSSQAIAAGIFQINTSLSTFKRYVNSIGTSKDTPELREKLHHTRQHIGRLAKDVSAKLKSASETDKVNEVKASKRVSDAKLAKDFQAVLNDFQNAQRVAAEKEATYTPILQVQVNSNQTTEDAQLSDEARERQYLLSQQKRQELIQLENEVVFNEAIIEEREQGIKDIQQQIVEVNEIFKDLAVLVHEQGVMIEDIDSNIQSTHSTTTQANSQLAKAAKSQKSNSSLMCWLLIAFGVILVVVIVVLVVVRP